MKKSSLFGWPGTVLGLGIYGLFAAGMVSEAMFYAVGCIASTLLIIAFAIDGIRYALLLQSAFTIFNTVGLLRLLFSGQ